MSHPDLVPAQDAPRGVLWALWRLRFTLVFLAIMVLANGLAGTFSGQIDPAVLGARGIGLEAIGDGDLTRFVSAIFLSHDLQMALRQLVFAGVVIGTAEWVWGSGRAAGLFFGLDITATLVLLAVLTLVPALGAQAGVTDVGMSMGGFGLIGALLGASRRGFAGMVAVLALIAGKYALSPETLADLGHVIALVIGFSVGSIGASTRVLAPVRIGRGKARA